MSNKIKSIDLINYLLESIPKLQDKFEFIDDSDACFLKDYFEHSKVFFSLMDNFEEYENDTNFSITETQFDEVTNSVRKVSKKYRDAAKLLHILKKPNFKALFYSLQQLDNQTYIQEPYIGDLHEINIDFELVTLSKDLQDYPSSSETISDNTDGSEESEENISGKLNFPAYQDVQYSKNEDVYSDLQVIGLYRDPKQPLGITVTKHEFEYNNMKITRCMVERILVNSIVDQQGLLQLGDIIFELNDQSVDSPETLQRLLIKCTGQITFKIMKSLKRPTSNMVNLEKSFVRALFDYEPSQDKLIPSESIGLSFACGDVFEILNRDDPNFWQALPLDCTKTQALLVPSQGLQERRIALEADLKYKSNENSTNKGLRRKSKKNELFRAQDAADIISEADLRTYEEVVKFPPSRVPCLLLLGPAGVGKRAIKHLIVQKEPNRFAFPIQDTTEPKRGRNQPLFNHVDRNTMLNDIKSCLYVCLDENAGELYGIKSSTIRELINQNKTVVLDCKPKDVYSMKLPVFNPYVILIAAPSISTMEAMQKEGTQRNLTKNKRSTTELQDIIDQSNKFQFTYQHLIHSVIVNDNIAKTVHKISSLVSEFENSDSWIPAAWENDIITLQINPKDISRDSIKSPDNLSIGQTTIQRRFEKKNEKPSISLSEKKIAIVGKSQDINSSDNSSDSYSETEVVKATPLKYSFVEKVEEDALINDDEHVQIKPKQRVSLTRQPNRPLSKGESLKIKDDQSKLSTNPQISQKPMNINLKSNTHSNVKKGGEVKEKDITTRLPEKETKRLPEKETKKLPVKETKKNPEKEITKLPVKEIINAQANEKIPPNMVNNKAQNRPKLIKKKESSSSDMSDTTSEDDSQGLKENRV